MKVGNKLVVARNRRGAEQIRRTRRHRSTTRFPILGANDRINIGQVGIGGRGADHINYYSSLASESRIAAICDVNQAARERGVAQVKKLGGTTPTEFDDMRKMFESKEDPLFCGSRAACAGHRSSG